MKEGIISLNLDINSVILIAGILLVLIFLKTIINNQEKMISKLSHREDVPKTISEAMPAMDSKEKLVPLYKGTTKGDAKIIGVDDDEITAVILTAVSHASNIPLNSLKVKSIKKL